MKCRTPNTTTYAVTVEKMYCVEESSTRYPQEFSTTLVFICFWCSRVIKMRQCCTQTPRTLLISRKCVYQHLWRITIHGTESERTTRVPVESGVVFDQRNTTEYTHYTYNPANVRRVEDTPVFPVFIKYNPSSRPVQLDTSDAVAFTTCKTCVLMCV